MSEEQWQCACGETDITKHDLGMAIAHYEAAYIIAEQYARLPEDAHIWHRLADQIIHAALGLEDTDE